jgi:hypothetical protein
MNIDSILSDLRAQRDRLDHAIAALEGSSSKRGRPASTNSAFPTRRRHFSAATRKRMSDAMKKRWASGKMKGNRRTA